MTLLIFMVCSRNWRW